MSGVGDGMGQCWSTGSGLKGYGWISGRYGHSSVRWPVRTAGNVMGRLVPRLMMGRITICIRGRKLCKRNE